MSLTVDGDKTINLAGTDSICIETSNLEARLINLEENHSMIKLLKNSNRFILVGEGFEKDTKKFKKLF